MASTRRLAAIMFTDMVGSTAAAQSDEARALKLRDEQADLVRSLFTAHQGREVKSIGDGFLAEFDSALRAVECAVDIQQRLQERNAQPGVTPIQLRIGVHLGDVEQRATDIFGDAVNVASRIEPLAVPGGVCISGEVFSQVRNKIPNPLEKLPPTSLKGVLLPVDVYRVVLPGAVRERLLPGSGPSRLAVLPLSNISPDPKDEYFADGLTEELIAVLSKLRELRVIARTSVSQYKSTTKSVAQIGAELGVDSVLEGSVRKSGDDLRITVQLIDVGTQEHTWANSYDRKLERVFALQSELATEVAEALRIELGAADRARLEPRGTVRPDSYVAYLKGRARMQENSETALLEAKHQFELAISLDRDNAAAYSGLADATRLYRWYHSGYPPPPPDENEPRLATRAIELDPRLAEPHASLGIILWDSYEYPEAERELRLAISLNPSYAAAHEWYANLLMDEGRADEALRELELAEAADPCLARHVGCEADLLTWLGRYDEALSRIERVKELDPGGMRYLSSLARYHFARGEEATLLSEVRKLKELEPDPSGKGAWQILYHICAGEKETARALIRHEESLASTPVGPMNFAWWYAHLGDLDDAFRWLDRAYAAHLLPLQEVRLSLGYAPLRADPRFSKLLEKMHLA